MLSDHISKLAELEVPKRALGLSDLLTSYNLNFVYFYHVPKTAGSTISETLETRVGVPVISVDATKETFIRHVKRALSSASQHKIFVRSHLAFPNVETALRSDNCRLKFSVFRDPLNVHISNAKMILRRVNIHRTTGHDNQGVREFSEYWDERLTNLDIDNFDTAVSIEKLLISEAYKTIYQNIYTGYFGRCTENDLDDIFFFNQDYTDRFLEIFFNVPSGSERRNSGSSLLGEGKLNKDFLYEELVSKGEKRICETIISRCEHPNQLFVRHRKVFENTLR